MKTLCIVPCGNSKIWDKKPDAVPTKARDVYIGTFAKKCREYAEKFYPTSWCILSAKWGFLFPEDIIEGNYNVSFNDRFSNAITIKELSTQVREKELDNYERVVILGGKNYVKIAYEVFSSKESLATLSGCKGIGYIMMELNNAIKRGIPL